MKLRPVRLAPCAAGASPTTTMRRSGHAEAGHRPAPVLLVGERAALRPSDLFPPGHQPRARPAHRDPRAQLGSADADAASARTSPTSWATAVRLVARSPGQPVPGRTTMDDSVACPSRVAVTPSTPSPETTWPRLAALWVGGSSRMRSASRLGSPPEGRSRGSGRLSARPPGSPPRSPSDPNATLAGSRHLDDDLRGWGGRGRERDDAGGRPDLAKPHWRRAAAGPRRRD